MSDHDIAESMGPATVGAAPTAFPPTTFNLAGAEPTRMNQYKQGDRTRVQRAIDHLREHGPATNDEISRAMGLKPGAHPGSYLAVAVKDGRLDTREGRWHLGPGRRPVAVPRPSAREDAPPATEQELLDEASQQAADVQESAHAPACIHIFPTDVAVVARADGSMLIAVDGQAVDVTAKQARLMQAFGSILAHNGALQ
ncbi:hypothetical protein [Cupriavidus alkaliphilus]|uniref:hypothetical protein n=1 Tax=Cupriavidus alkaliphilus TaxID=942866 RepID=UPI00339D8275